MSKLLHNSFICKKCSLIDIIDSPHHTPTIRSNSISSFDLDEFTCGSDISESFNLLSDSESTSCILSKTS